MSGPVRVQRSRAKWSRLPDNTICVDRSTRWGNPCKVGMFKGYTAADAVRDFRLWIDRDPQVRSFEHIYGKPPTCEEIRAELHGKNLACWCKLTDKDGKPVPCHADALLELANAPLPSSQEQAS